MILLQNGKKPTIYDILKSRNDKNLLRKINQNSEEKRNYEPLINRLTFVEKCLIALIAESIDFNYNPIRSFLDNYQKITKKEPKLTLEEIVLKTEKVKAGGVKSKHCFKKSKINFDTTKSKSLY